MDSPILTREYLDIYFDQRSRIFVFEHPSFPDLILSLVGRVMPAGKQGR